MPDAPAPRLSVHIEGVRPLYWAAAVNGVLFVDAVCVRSEATEVERDLVLEIACDPPFLLAERYAVDVVPPGDEVVVREPRLVPDIGRLRALIEADDATLTARLVRDGAVVASATVPLRVLAYNEWDSRGRRDLLAAFVMPNHPAITDLVATARDVQGETFGRTEFEGYQSGDPERVMQQTAAVYGALQRLGISYLAMPASFEAHGQKLRSPEALRAEKQGNCIDIATWTAAALEACGLRPVIVLLRGHAFAGVWLSDEPHSLDPVETDASTVRKQVQAGRLLLVETTAATTRPSPSFAEACGLGLEKIDDRVFEEMIDVRGARTAGIRPLNVTAGGASASPGVPVDVPDLTLPAAAPRPAAPKDAGRHGRFDKWVAELMDLSLRNGLIGATMSDDPRAFGERRPKKGLLLAAVDVAALENDLADGKRLRLILDAPPGPEAVDRAARQQWVEALADLQRQQRLVVDPGTPGLPERIRRVWKQHRELVEEKGASSLHVAIGALRWFESESSTQARYAPLLLVPAQVERVSLAGEYALSLGDGETVFNAALVQKLGRDFGVDLAPLAADLPEDDGGIDVDAVFAHVTQQVMRLRRFEVLPTAWLGFFEYRKQLMARDLRAMVESGEAAPNPFLGSLLPELAREMRAHYGDAGAARSFCEATELDDRIPAAQLPLVVDADSSQLAAVHAAMEGRSFVLQGPPGTGKSQTITNLIACLLGAGRRVLFVAEKRAALSVVASRLARAGLEAACLELHGESVDGRSVAQSLVSALDDARPRDAADFDRVAREVDQARVRLNALVRRLHAPTPLGMTYFEASARRHRLRDVHCPGLDAPSALDTTAEAFEDWRRALCDLERAIADCGGWAGHPLRASRLDAWTERRQDAAGNALASLAETVRAASAAVNEAAVALRIDPGTAACDPAALVDMLRLLGDEPPGWVRQLSSSEQREDYLDALEALHGVAARMSARHAALSERWTDGLYALDVGAMASVLRSSQSRWWPARWWSTRSTRRALRGVCRGRPGAVDALVRDLDDAAAVREDASALDAASAAVVALMGPAFAGSRTRPEVFARARDARRWVQLLSRLATASSARGVAAPDVRTPLPSLDAAAAAALAERLAAALAAVRQDATAVADSLHLERAEAFGVEDPIPRLAEVAAFAHAALAGLGRLRDKTASEHAARAADALGLGRVVAAVREGRVPEDRIAVTWESAFLRTWVDAMTEAHPELTHFRGREHDRIIASFRADDRALLEAGKRRVAYEVARRRPDATVAAHADSEVGILRREAMKRRRRMPVRRLLAALPTLLPKLKPCFLMSPLAVAHFLPPDVEKFDAVIFDEASQVPTADAIGALWRGKQVIVVGDSKQMPPTSFFSVAIDDEDDADGDGIASLESILDEAVASGVPSLMLAWHYRSRDERLIAFSNRHYYGDRLLTFPAADPLAEGSGVFHDRVAGVFDRGASRRNEVEARRVVEIVVESLRDPATRDRSIGVVTFNAQQQDLIDTLLDRARQEHPEIEPYFTAAAPEPVFVKNLENVQGDERDVMIFSTTYGRDAAGRTSVNFGPMNRIGGERRLNVAITRARERLVVVTSLDPEDIDLNRTGAVGVRHFREFLRYARDGVRALVDGVRVDGGAACESPFEEDVRAACESLGWRVDRQVGCSGYRIDLALRDPRHPGRHLLGIECDGATYHSAATARDRDRLRHAVLENLGWTLHRIWSTDWRLDRAGELARLEKAYAAALAMPRRPPGKGANTTLRSQAELATEETPRAAAAPPLAAANASVRPRVTATAIDPSSVTDRQRRDAVLFVLNASGSMPQDALIREAALRVGHQRVGVRIREAFQRIVDDLVASGDVRWLDDRLAPKA